MAVSVGGFVGLFTPVASSTSTTVAEVMQVGDLLYLATGDLTLLRIQQPGSFDHAELEAAGVQLGRELTQLVVAPEPTDSQLVIVPPDGPDARVHLLVDGVLYPVVVNDAEHADLSVFEDAPIAILGRLDVAG
jgi:hypothetical protein